MRSGSLDASNRELNDCLFCFYGFCTWNPVYNTFALMYPIHCIEMCHVHTSVVHVLVAMFTNSAENGFHLNSPYIYIYDIASHKALGKLD